MAARGGGGGFAKLSFSKFYIFRLILRNLLNIFIYLIINSVFTYIDVRLSQEFIIFKF